MASTSTHARKRVCLFGLSANPPTGSGGHLGVVSYLASLPHNYWQDSVDNGHSIEEFANKETYFDEVRVLPVYQHMFSEKRA
mmetsp:Transcript_5492/g.7996  ORF Transcript_5492/g.7996 Transcript_5492/m.7996 type:complete len:82 (+) Transcript_5492:80-325(+)